MCVLNDFDVVYLKSILEYKPEAGSWDWFVSKGNQKAGSKAGSIRKSDGYYRIKINGKEYVSHRLAWLYMTGEWPTNEIDHIDLNKLNNKWKNLREATHSQNMANVALLSNNTSGYKGVFWHKQNLKWMVQIKVNNKRIYLGSFVNKEDAVEAYKKAAKKYFGEFAR